MGQKVHPIGFRLGIYRPWPSKWFARDNAYSKLLFEDIKIRDHVRKSLAGAEISSIEIEKASDNIKVIVFSAKPGVAIGKKGQEIDSLRKTLSKLTGKNVEVSVQEIKTPELDAHVVAGLIAEQIEKRASYKKVMKKAATSTMRAGAAGIKIRCAGRLAGAEIARDEWVRLGSVPLHTLRADIDYALVVAHTIMGCIGVKVWICRGEYKLVKSSATKD